MGTVADKDDQFGHLNFENDQNNDLQSSLKVYISQSEQLRWSSTSQV